MLKSDKNISNNSTMRDKALIKGKTHRGEGIIKRYRRAYKDQEEGFYWYEDTYLFIKWFEEEFSGQVDKTFMRNKQWLLGYLKESGYLLLARAVEGLYPASRQAKLDSKVSDRLRFKTENNRVRNGSSDTSLESVGGNTSVDSLIASSNPSEQIELLEASGRGISGSSRLSWINNDKGLMAAQLTRDEIEDFFNAASLERRPTVPLYIDGRVVSIYFQLIAMTGIRPSEWCRIKLVENLTDSTASYGFGISVIGAEKGANKGKGTVSLTRHLNCNHWTDREKSMLRAFEEAVLSASGRDGKSDGDDSEDVGKRFAGLLNNYKSTFRCISKRTFGNPRYLNFYDARHLYAAEFRRAKAGNKFALAAAMGHTDIVNQRYYGDYKDTESERVFKWSLALPIKSEELVVKANAERRHERSLERIAKTFGRESKRIGGSSGDW
jgi:hypothetical protein